MCERRLKSAARGQGPAGRKVQRRADEDMRQDMLAAGVDFVPLRNEAWYGFPIQRPPEEHRA
jgi:hypothetical protein